MLESNPLILNWRNAEPIEHYYYNLDAQPKERARNHVSAINTRTWEGLISDATTEQREPGIPVIQQRIGARVLYRLPACPGDLDNYLKSVFDAMQRLAFHDDSQIDYIECARVAYSGRPLIQVELLKL